jgi:hypothetical protein
MKNTSGRRRPPYVARFCSCGSPALYAVQVLVRTVGQGQSKANRKIKLGRTAILCAECSRNASKFIDELGRSSVEALDQVRRPARIQGTPLFDQAEA